MSWIVTFSCQLHYVGITGITVPWLGHTVPRVHEDNVSINTHHSKGYPELSLNGFKQPSLRTWGVWRSHTDLVSDCHDILSRWSPYITYTMVRSARQSMVMPHWTRNRLLLVVTPWRLIDSRIIMVRFVLWYWRCVLSICCWRCDLYFGVNAVVFCPFVLTYWCVARLCVRYGVLPVCVNVVMFCPFVLTLCLAFGVNVVVFWRLVLTLCCSAIWN